MQKMNHRYVFLFNAESSRGENYFHKLNLTEGERWAIKQGKAMLLKAQGDKIVRVDSNGNAIV
jgi:hypothetical protein